MFYSVIETRDFSLFNQSAQALLKGYFIMWYRRCGLHEALWGGMVRSSIVWYFKVF